MERTNRSQSWRARCFVATSEKAVDYGESRTCPTADSPRWLTMSSVHHIASTYEDNTDIYSRYLVCNNTL